ETFKDQLSFSLVLDKYLDEQIKIDEVSDEDAKEMYDNLKEQNEEIADYEELEGDIKKSLENQQTQEKLQANLEELKESADIEQLISKNQRDTGIVCSGGAFLFSCCISH